MSLPRVVSTCRFVVVYLHCFLAVQKSFAWRNIFLLMCDFHSNLLFHLFHIHNMTGWLYFRDPSVFVLFPFAGNEIAPAKYRRMRVCCIRRIALLAAMCTGLHIASSRDTERCKWLFVVPEKRCSAALTTVRSWFHHATLAAEVIATNRREFDVIRTMAMPGLTKCDMTWLLFQFKMEKMDKAPMHAVSTV